MGKKDFHRIIRNPRHIPGVHNYCDRWCQRCPLTLRCSVFAMEAVLDKDTPPHDKRNESLWPRLDTLRPFAEQLLAENADHPGVGLSPKPIFKNINRPVDSHRLGAAAKRYMEFTHTFIKDHGNIFPTLPLLPDFSITAAEAFEIISWHHMSITVKLSRALHRDELDEEIESDPEFADMPSDHDGSAKIALLSIDRSIIAWAALTTLAPQFHVSALSAALTLHRLRLGIEKRFPKARNFQRPGFDTLRFK